MKLIRNSSLADEVKVYIVGNRDLKDKEKSKKKNVIYTVTNKMITTSFNGSQ